MKSMATAGVSLLLLPALLAQKPKPQRKGEFYFSWGYNKEWYTKSNVRVNQPAINNNYTLKNVTTHDNVGWDKGIFNLPLSIPQYNYRIGYFFNKQKGLGWEINFDHTKHILTDGQTARLQGTLGGRAVDTSVLFAKSNGFYYYLNNGANFLLFNFVKRWHWAESKDQKIKLDFLGKAGIGPLVPHVENAFFGQANNDGFQLGGWNMGLETALRSTFFHHVYLEFSQKIDYARYTGLKVYKGKAKETFGTYELILSLGYTFGAGKRIASTHLTQ